ncbi:MAG: hypothetical protein IAA97_02145 [Spirochaetes bacterium]|uniref:Uncharacterized protein n=1 Tax=Candidatus Ornithospirochaeta stercoripullorum TaxID=2840899 RepID=A0A9D9E074_9SPIO|nr:hypothetical protein [Candidatus Ornithospirochaeta stercoripullorum]
MSEKEVILDTFASFKSGMQQYLARPEIPKELKPRHESTSTRIAACLRPFFPPAVNIDTGLMGADIVIWKGDQIILALFWSSSYLGKERRLKAIAFHEKRKPLLTLAFSIFPKQDTLLVCRIENGFIDYLHIKKDTFMEEVLRRCTIEEGKKDDGQLLLPLGKRN